MSEKLKKCPFCEKEVADIANCIELEDCANFEECGNSGWVCVVCNANKGGCGATGGYADSEEKAILKWNTRASDENPPLSLDELRQMEGEPVWIDYLDGHYGIVNVSVDAVVDGSAWFYDFTDYGEGWLAYRRKPKEEVKE